MKIPTTHSKQQHGTCHVTTEKRVPKLPIIHYSFSSSTRTTNATTTPFPASNHRFLITLITFVSIATIPRYCASFPLPSSSYRSIITTFTTTKPQSSSSSSSRTQPQAQPRPPRSISVVAQNAKRRKNNNNERDDDLNRWYDEVDENATPGDVFWDEMERRRRIVNGGGNNDGGAETASGYPNRSRFATGPDIDMVGEIDAFDSSSDGMGMMSTGTGMGMGGMGGIGGGGGGNVNGGSLTPGSTMSNEQSAEAALSPYEAHMVSDNWLDDEYLKELAALEEEKQWDPEEQERDLMRQLEEWEREGDTGDENESNDFGFKEPWDLYAEEIAQNNPNSEQLGNIDLPAVTNEVPEEFLFQFDDDLDDDDETDETDETETETTPSVDDLQTQQEAQRLERLSQLHIQSRRLTSASLSPHAAAYFSRPPNSSEGYTQLWVSAVDNLCQRNLHCSLGSYGIEFADNFGDWTDGCDEDGFASIEEVASRKARMVYEVTGLPCIASRTSWEIEPIRPTERGNLSPRVVSGYKFNDVKEYVDYVADAMRPLSAPTRVTRFRSCYCYYDGEMEVFDYGELDCDLHFCDSMRTYIPTSFGIKGLSKKLALEFGLEYEGWMRKKLRDAVEGRSGADGEEMATVKLRDRLLKDGRVLKDGVIDVSAFMDSKVDVNLMDDCGKDLAEKLAITRPTKILTVATTGLIIAMPMAKYLQIPVVYARKERSIVMSSTFQASYTSKTYGTTDRELIVSKDHISKSDRILVVDDFLSSGSTQEALFKIVADSGAKAVGVGVLLEKVYDAGRRTLAGFDVPVESLVRVSSVEGGVLRLVEEDGFSGM